MASRVRASSVAAECIVCYSPFSSAPHSKSRRVLMPCNHSEICSICILRIRVLHANLSCPICKDTNDTVIVPTADSPNTAFNQFQVWGDEIGPEYSFDVTSRMFLPTTYETRHIAPLFSLRCGMKTQGRQCDFNPSSDELPPPVDKSTDIVALNNQNPPPNLVPLLEHLHHSHSQSTICVLCYTNKRTFLSQLRRLSPDNFARHMKKGDGEKSGFDGHPLCEFCAPRRFYDLEQLHMHLNKDHYKCHLCQQQGNSNQFFKDYTKLERHFDRDHFMCSHASCRQARFVAFSNEMDYKAHMIEVHGNASTDTKINFQFNVRSSNRDGSGAIQDPFEGDNPSNFPAFAAANNAFVPPELPSHGDDLSAITDPAHRDRTAALQAEANEIRLNNQRETDYPELMSGGSAAFVGWGGGGPTTASVPAHQSLEDAFPLLMGDPKKKPSSRRDPRAPRNNNISGLTQQAFEQFQTAKPSGKKSSTLSSIAGSNSAPSPAYQSSANSTWGAAVLSASSSSGSASASWASAAPAPVQQAAPDFNAASEFPSMDGGKKKAARRDPRAPRPVVSARPQFLSAEAAASHHRVQLDVLKSNLSKDAYKALKKITKDFFNDKIETENYVNQASVLFDGRGKMFQDFMPALLSSLPDEMKVTGALSLVDGVAQQMLEWERGEGGGAEEEEEVGGWGGGAVRDPPRVEQMVEQRVEQRPAPVRAESYVPPPFPPRPGLGMGCSKAKPARTTLTSGLNVKFGGSKSNAWGTSAGGGKKKGESATGGGIESAAVVARDVGTASRGEAMYKKQLRREQQQEQEKAQSTGKKGSKANKKKSNEDLRNAIFG